MILEGIELATVIAEDSRAERSESAIGWMWKRYRLRRRRAKARKQAMIRFRPTREGLHFVGVLLFIFFGAVVRDINLLILLAGAMIGLLVLQWRFNVRTLVGVRLRRHAALAAVVESPTRVLVELINPKRWLGSWLVLVEDPIRRVAPQLESSSGKGAVVVDEVRPQGKSEGSYELTFHRRGTYELGPSTISTRFPIGLGRGWRTLDNQVQVTVRPGQGMLLPTAKSLFQLEQQGNAMTAPKSGVNEAEFYGLRPWATGDSRRWIHWRTTARLGELSVRQFERQQHQQMCILLDLCDGEELREDEMEKAISFVATVASNVVLQRRGKIAVAVAGQTSFAAPLIQSPVLLDNLLDQLANVWVTPNPDLEAALKPIGLALASNPRLLVVSTRPEPSNLGITDEANVMGRIMARVQLRWLNVCDGDLDRYFEWTSNDSND